MPIFISGSLAFDSILVFHGKFADQVLPEQLHQINVSFYLHDMRRDFGGCAGNIAYGLRLLGAEPIPICALGANDSKAYRDHLSLHGICQSHVRDIPATYSAQAIIMTDMENNQITGFFPGAMDYAHLIHLDSSLGATLGVISPNSKPAMLQHASEMTHAGIHFVFDPGQCLPLFNKEELLQFISQCDWIVTNDYESKMLCDRVALTPEAISQRVQCFVITQGSQGCEIIIENGIRTHVAAPAVPPEAVQDPTGCGDAWRCAFLYGLEHGWSFVQCARLGNAVGAAKIRFKGPQSYQIDANTLINHALA